VVKILSYIYGILGLKAHYTFVEKKKNQPLLTSCTTRH